MTPLTKRRHSTMRQGRRRAVHAMVLPNLIECTNCHQPTRPHRSCTHCSFYKGKKVN